MADNEKASFWRGFWAAVIEYKWIVLAVVVGLGFGRGWWSIPLVERMVAWVAQLISAGVPG